MLKNKPETDAKPKITDPQIKITDQTKLSDSSFQSTGLSEDCKWEFSKLNARVTSMGLAMQEYSKELQVIREKVDTNSVETALNSYEKKQDSVLAKLTKIG
jgi:hypothetical protein